MKHIYRLCIIALLMVSGVFISLSLGSESISFWDTAQYLFTLNPDISFILHEIRGPRVFMAVAVGMSLAISGVLMQNLIHNPLASPDILGISTGGAMMVVLGIALFPEVPTSFYPLLSIIGSSLILGLIFILTRKKMDTFRLVLIGIALETTGSALIMIFLLLAKTYSTSSAYHWLIGSLYSATWGKFIFIMAIVVIGGIISMLAAHHMDVFGLKEDVSRGLGLHIGKHRVFMILLSMVLCAIPIAYAGAIGFVGLIAPHIARLIIGRQHILLIPSAALIGGSIVLFSDTVARTMFLPLDLPVGVFVAGVGAPFFLFLLITSKDI